MLIFLTRRSHSRATCAFYLHPSLAKKCCFRNFHPVLGWPAPFENISSVHAKCRQFRNYPCCYILDIRDFYAMLVLKSNVKRKQSDLLMTVINPKPKSHLANKSNQTQKKQSELEVKQEIGTKCGKTRLR